MTKSATDSRPARRIGIDVGGTKCLGVALHPDGAVADEVRVATPRDPHALMGVFQDMAVRLGPAQSLGIGLPGAVGHNGVMVASAHLPAMVGEDVATTLRTRLGCQVWVGNDATCATVAEHRFGAGAGVDDMVLVTLGTGIGGGIVSDGRVRLGAHGFAGEFGHMCIVPDGPPCPCGGRGCWELWASGSGLARLAREAAADGALEVARARVGGDIAAISGEHVHACAREGDAQARAVVDHFAGWVALGLANLVNALDPAAIVMGGGLADDADLYRAPLQRHLDARVYGGPKRPRPDLRVASLGPRAGAVGAAVMGAPPVSP